MQTLISAEQLLSDIDDPAWKIFDCRFSLQDAGAGEKAYRQGHIPGAFYAHMEKDLSGSPIEGVTGRHPLPDKGAWIRKVTSWGITPETQVVVYDDAGGAVAARMWWMLLWIGHANARVLDGGWQAWLAAGGKMSTEQPARSAGETDHYSRLPSLTRQVSTEQINPDGQLLLDARDYARYCGEKEPIDPVAGHIPEAICSSFSNNLTAEGKFKSKEELKRIYWEVNATFLPVVCYCGSGVTACHNILAIVHAGLDMPHLYPGSWSEWITDPNRPVATIK